MKNSTKTPNEKKITVKYRESWTSSWTKMMNAAGKAAYSRAVLKAREYGTPIWSLQGDTIIKRDPYTIVLENEKK